MPQKILVIIVCVESQTGDSAHQFEDILKRLSDFLALFAEFCSLELDLFDGHAFAEEAKAWIFGVFGLLFHCAHNRSSCAELQVLHGIFEIGNLGVLEEIPPWVESRF